jgi:2-keto-4-pentenoate hydratase/2-oxohepta-3-ene-1,7-dioic acid hydratase in catechol pathway
MQDSNTNQMVFTIAEQISFLSTRLTLNPGDVIMTGTPAGVGMPRRRFLNPGEEIRLEIDQIGSFRHTVA